MTKTMDQAIEALRSLPPERQDEIAPALLMLADQEAMADWLTLEERAELEEAADEIERGEISTDAEVRAMLAKHGL